MFRPQHLALFLFGLATGLSVHSLYSRRRRKQQQNDENSTTTATPHILVDASHLEVFCRQCLVQAGCSPENASTAARVIIAADLRGISSHGVQRLYLYCHEIQTGAVNGRGRPRVCVVDDQQQQQYLACRVVDGNNCQGAVVGHFCVEVAMDLARRHGCAMVAAKNSNHFGIAGYYTDLVANNGNGGMIGMCMTNTSPIVVPTNAREPCLGTNPLAISAPTAAIQGKGQEGDPIRIDMATTTVPIGRVEVYLSNNNKPLPSLSWAVDSHGVPCTDPYTVIHQGGAMLPLGGATSVTGGHKGYCLSLLVELLCGVLTGFNFGKNVDMTLNPRVVTITEEEGTSSNPHKGGQISHWFLVINPNVFSSSANNSYAERARLLVEQLRSLPPLEDSNNTNDTNSSNESGKFVRVPGDRSHAEEVKRLKQGIPLPFAVWNSLHTLSQTYQVPLPSSQVVVGEL